MYNPHPSLFFGEPPTEMKCTQLIKRIVWFVRYRIRKLLFFLVGFIMSKQGNIEGERSFRGG
jgi:hypothetical protein